MPYPTTSRSETPFGTALILPLTTLLDLPELTPLVPIQTPITGPPGTSNLHPQSQNPEPPVTAFVALTFVIVIPSSQEHPQCLAILFSGTQSLVINL